MERIHRSATIKQADSMHARFKEVERRTLRHEEVQAMRLFMALSKEFATVAKRPVLLDH